MKKASDRKKGGDRNLRAGEGKTVKNGDIEGERTEGVGSREEAIARRLYIDKLASAGIDSGRLSVEILFMLPIEFVHEYTRLFNDALAGINNGKSQGNRIDAENKKASVPGHLKGKKIGATGNTGKKVINGHWFVKDEESMDLKVKLDRKLVKLVGEIRAERSVRRNGRQCVGNKCRSFLKDDWRFCPQCGSDNGRV